LCWNSWIHYITKWRRRRKVEAWELSEIFRVNTLRLLSSNTNAPYHSCVMNIVKNRLILVSSSLGMSDVVSSWWNIEILTLSTEKTSVN
jgi:hypothetical protein